MLSSLQSINATGVKDCAECSSPMLFSIPNDPNALQRQMLNTENSLTHIFPSEIVIRIWAYMKPHIRVQLEPLYPDIFDLIITVVSGKPF